MSVIATAVKHLLAAGVTGDALVAAIAEMEASAPPAKPSGDAAAERRREWDRNRRREERAATRAAALSTVSGGCPVDTADIADKPAPAPSSSPDPSNNPTPTRKGTPARTRGGGSWPCPDGVNPEHWADVMANRKSKRLANTPTALAGILRDLAKLSDDEWPPGRIVQHAAERGWGAIFDPRPRDTRNAEHRAHRQPAGRSVDGFTTALRRASAELEARDAC